MAFRSDETYVTVLGTLRRRTAKAALIETELGEGWVARSCCHFTTDRSIEAMALGDEGEFQIMEWVAEKNGLI